jgi:hypothetical protein
MTADAFRLDQKKRKVSPQIRKKDPPKEQRVEGRREKNVKKRRQFLSNRQSGITHGHVVAGAGESTGHRSDQFTGHPEVAKFDNPFTG